METNYLTDIMLPLSLAIIMLGMGLSLVPYDFKRVALYPRAAFIGLLNQLIVLPIVGFLLLLLSGFRSPELAVGIMILAACPGGPTSNLISHISRGDTALSITLTAISSLVTVITIPLIINLALSFFMKHGEYVPLPVFRTIITLILITTVPVIIGMMIRSKAVRFANRMNKPVKIASGVLIFVIILGVILENKAIIIDAFRNVGHIALSLNIVMLLIGYLSAKLLKLNIAQRITISVESGIQNGTLGIYIASILLANNQMAISPALYSLLMFITAGFIIAWTNLGLKKVEVTV